MTGTPLASLSIQLLVSSRCFFPTINKNNRVWAWLHFEHMHMSNRRDTGRELVQLCRSIHLITNYFSHSNQLPSINDTEIRKAATREADKLVKGALEKDLVPVRSERFIVTSLTCYRKICSRKRKLCCSETL